MHWPSRWGEGFPGWHLECSTMSTKYLGEEFDIHGGGMDLLFPHHECEIAQSTAALGKESVKYWMHNNLITINGQKMGKSLGNAISLFEFFSGDHPLLEKAYHPMAIRFFIMQAHYRSTVDFSNEAIQASEKGLQRLFEGINTLGKLNASEQSTVDVHSLEEKCYNAMNDDLNSPVLISHLFDGLKMVNFIHAGQDFINGSDLKKLKDLYQNFVYDILGMDQPEEKVRTENLSDQMIHKFLEVRQEAKKRKDFTTADLIRNTLNQLGIEVKDTKDGFEWKVNVQ
jgi:cysteinyl-tRNA synthetase